MDWIFLSKLFLAIFFTLVAVVYTVRLTVGDKTPQDAKVFTGEKYSNTWWNHFLFRIFRIAIWLICVARVFFAEIDSGLGVFTSLMHPYCLLPGMVVMCSGFVFASAAHRQLGTSWRSGIDPQGPNALHTNGLYGYSRNPIFIGVIWAQFGFFLTLPSIFSLCCLLLGVTSIVRQVYQEELHLNNYFDKDYTLYKNNVPRWL